MDVPNLLVIDDEEEILKIIRAILSAEGYRVATETDGFQGLARLAGERFDVVISDLMMPDIDGLTILREVKKRDPTAEVILITAYGSTETAIEALRQGAYDYITKPFNRADLVHAVKQALNYRALHREKDNLLFRLQQQRDDLQKMLDAAKSLAQMRHLPADLAREVNRLAHQHLNAVTALTVYNAKGRLLFTATADMFHPQWQKIFSQHPPHTHILQSLWSNLPRYSHSFLLDPQQTGLPWPPAETGNLPPLLMTPLAESDRSPAAILWAQGVTNPPAIELVQKLEIFGSHLHSALENAHFLAAQQQMLQARNRLVEASRRITTILNPTELLQTILEAALAVVEHAGMAVIYAGSAAGWQTLSLTRGDPVPVESSPVPESVLRQILIERQTTYLPRWSDWPASPEASLLAEPIGTTSIPVGVLALLSDSPDAFDDDDFQLMEMLADQAAIALQNARLYQEARRADELEALQETGQAIVSSLDLHDVAMTAMSFARGLTGASACCIHLYRQIGPTIEPDTVITLDDQKPFGPADCQKAAELSRQTVESGRTEAWIWRAPAQEAAPGDIKAWLSIPLVAGQTVLGTMELGSEDARAFNQDDIRLTGIIAVQTTTAVQNANLFRELSSAYQDLSRQQEEILRKTSTLRALFNSITDGLYIVDRDHRIVAINQAEADRLKQPVDMLIGRVCSAALWGQAAEPLAELIDRTFTGGQEGAWEADTAGPAGDLFRDRSVRTYPIFKTRPETDTAGGPAEVEQVIIFAQDVSEQRRLQASLFRSANLAAVGQLASSIAHQINNPLTVVVANAQLLEMELDPSSPDYALVQDILQAGEQIRHAVQNLLDFSMQERYEWFETSVSDTIGDALLLAGHSLRKSRIRVEEEIAPLPEIIASASHLKLLWLNLILNARDAITARLRGETGGEPAEEGVITVRAHQKNPDQLEVQITDNGVGILPEHQDRLFHPFFTTKGPKHMGLGLYTCRAIVERHSGQIDVANNTGQPGVTVTVVLPVRQ